MANEHSNSDKAMPSGTSRHRRPFNMTGVAWRVFSLWGVFLLIGALGALVHYWLDTRPNTATAAPAVPAEDTAPAAELPVTDAATMARIQAEMERQASLRPRTVEEMLNEAEGGDMAYLPPDLVTPSVPEPIRDDTAEDIASLPEEHQTDMSDELSGLLREARYAQIEGDMRRSIVHLEQALEIAPDNPVVCYYYGLAYEFLRNGPKSREFFSKVVTQREAAGKYYQLASLHLERGFSSPADVRGDMSFGTILEYREPDTGQGERVILTIPVLMKDGLNVRPDDLYIPIYFFDSVNGKSIDLTRAQEPVSRWITEPVDWAEGEEILEVQYYMPPLTQEELTAYGDIKYYGYTAKLYYKGEPMDCRASPPVLFLIEQMKSNKSGYPGYDDVNLFPPLDAVPMSEDMAQPPLYVEPGDDTGLLPP